MARALTIEGHLARKEVTASGCWELPHKAGPKGYKHLSTAGRAGRAHKVIWEFFNGPVPAGKELDHTCNNRGCVNPEHLEPVDHATNCARAALRRTHCKRRHPLIGDNVKTLASGERKCRTCWLEGSRRWSRAQTAARQAAPGYVSPRKLDETQAEEIRRGVEAAEAAARRYGVSKWTIYDIRSGRTHAPNTADTSPADS